MKKIVLCYFIFYLSVNLSVLASDTNLKDNWLYEFDPKLINKIEISKNNEEKGQIEYTNLIYKGEKQNIDNFSKNCKNINLTQKNNENLIYRLPDGCNISFFEEVETDGVYSLIIYLCNNKGCEKADKPFLCIEDNEDDCGF